MPLDVVTQIDVNNALASHEQARNQSVGSAAQAAAASVRAASLWANDIAAKISDPDERQAAGLAMAGKIAAAWSVSKTHIATILDVTAAGMIDQQTGQPMTRAQLLQEVADVVLP